MAEEPNPAIYGVTDGEYKRIFEALDGYIDRYTRETMERNAQYYFAKPEAEPLEPTLLEATSRLQESVQKAGYSLQEALIAVPLAIAQVYTSMGAFPPDSLPPSVWEKAQDAAPVEFWSHGERLDANGLSLGLIEDFTQGKDYK